MQHESTHTALTEPRAAGEVPATWLHHPAATAGARGATRACRTHNAAAHAQQRRSRRALVDALEEPPALLPSPWPTGSSYTTHAVLVLDLTRTCDARESKARARKIPTATTDCQSIDAERDLARRRLEAAETLPAIARDRAPARACKPYDKRAMLRRSSGSCRHDIGEERPVSHLPQRE